MTPPAERARHFPVVHAFVMVAGVAAAFVAMPALSMSRCGQRIYWRSFCCSAKLLILRTLRELTTCATRPGGKYVRRIYGLKDLYHSR